jgi:hypothetical protein
MNDLAPIDDNRQRLCCVYCVVLCSSALLLFLFKLHHPALTLLQQLHPYSTTSPPDKLRCLPVLIYLAFLPTHQGV